MSDTVILDHIGGVEAAARIVDGQLEDFLLDDPERPRPGTIYRGVCERPVKGLGGLFVRLPTGTGFLRGAKGLGGGKPVLVQVAGHAEAGKAVPVTQRLLFKSRYAIVTPDAPGVNISRSLRDDAERVRLREIAEGAVPEGMGLILRTAAHGAPADAIADDIAAMRALALRVCDAQSGGPEMLSEGDGPHLLAWRDWPEPAEIVTEPGGFEREDVLDQLDALTDPSIPLGPWEMVVEETQALVAVDVNTRGDTSPAAGLKANLAAMRALPRALRLRGLGGQVVVDAAPMARVHRRDVETALKTALRADPVETAVLGWTALGHLELQRKRERASLHRLLRSLR